MIITKAIKILEEEGEVEVENDNISIEINRDEVEKKGTIEVSYLFHIVGTEINYRIYTKREIILKLLQVL